MVRVSGAIRLVTGRTAESVRINVRARSPRTTGADLVTDFTDTLSVKDGVVAFDCLPGEAVLLVEEIGAVQAVPLLVPQRDATLAECIEAAESADQQTRQGLEDLVFEIQDAVGPTREAAEAAQEAASRAASSASTATNSAKSSASAATSASGSAKAAATSAQNAKTSEQNAGSHASKAAQHEVAASTAAERAATIAGSTKWVGTKLEVNGKLSPDLKGEKGDKGDTGARGAQGQRGPQGDLGPKGDKGDPGKDGTMRFEDLTAAQRETLRGKDGAPGTTTWSGLTDKPSAFPPEEHKHTLADITNAPNSHTSAQTGSSLMSRDSAGRARVNNPAADLDIANKQYVDNAVSSSTPPPATWGNMTGKPATFPPASHQHVSGDVTDASNDIGEGKGGQLVKGRDSDGKVFTYTPISEVTDSRELVSKGWVDDQLKKVAGDQPKVQVVDSRPINPDPNTVYLIG